MKEIYADRLEDIRHPTAPVIPCGTLAMVSMRSIAFTAITSMVNQTPPPSFANFSETANVISNMFRTSGLQDCSKWVDYMRRIGLDLLYLEEASRIASPAETDETSAALTSLEAKMEAERSALMELKSARQKKIIIRNTEAADLLDLAAAVEAAKKALAEAERKYAEKAAKVEVLQQEEAAIEGDVIQHQTQLAEVKRECKRLKDEADFQAAARAYLERECTIRLERIRDWHDPLA